MKAVILAGGRGSRLAPYTTVFPKSLMPVGDKAILEIVLRQLRHYQFTDITLAVGHLAELIMAYCENGSRFGVKLNYSREQKPLGTAGPLSLIPGLTEHFLVMNGDVLTTLNYGRMMAFHKENGAIATVAVHPRSVQINLGVIQYDADHRLTNYIEKPIHNYEASMGIYIFDPKVLTFIPKDRPLDLPSLVNELVAARQTVKCYLHTGYWMDIGTPSDYEGAVAEFQELSAQLLPQEDK